MTDKFGAIHVDSFVCSNGEGNSDLSVIKVSGLSTIARSGITVTGDFNGTNIFLSGNLTVTGNTNVSGLFTISGLTVTGDTNVSGLLTTSGLTVTGDANVSGLFTTSGLTVTGNATVTGDANVSGLFTTSGLTVQNNLTVTGDVNASGNFSTTTGKVEGASGNFGSGTAANPSLTLGYGNYDNGLYSPNTHHVAFVTSGTERLRITDSGAFGLSGANYGISGQVITSVGGDGPPIWTTVSGGGGGASAINDLSDAVTYSSGQSIGLGTDALVNDDGTDNNNTALGYEALNATTTGSGNVSVGYQTLKANTDGIGNVAVGYQALTANTTGDDNIALGDNALAACTTGSNNVALGELAGQSLTTGSSNFFLGRLAGRQLTTSSNNVFLGAGAGSSTSGAFSNYNVAIGSNALGANRSSKSGSTAVGGEALQLETGEYNTGIGYQAGNNITTGSNNTCIGYDAEASSATVSNEITLGNTSVTSFRIPGLQSSATNGAVLTYNSTDDDLELSTTLTTTSISIDGPYEQTAEAVSALNIDCSSGNYFTKTITGDSTFTFSNVPSSGTACSFTVELVVSGDRTVQWPSGVKFNENESPSLTADRSHLFMFVTSDGGTVFRSSALTNYSG